MLSIGKFVRGNNGSRNWIGKIIDTIGCNYRVRDVRTGLYFYVSVDSVTECAKPVTTVF